MSTTDVTVDSSWAPPSCTLPTTDQPLRIQQFDQLFADAVTAVERIAPSTARFTLRPEPHLAARAAELSSRETSCCSFFTIALTFTQGAVNLHITVPATNVAILDALTDRARMISSHGTDASTDEGSTNSPSQS